MGKIYQWEKYNNGAKYTNEENIITVTGNL